MDNQQPSNNSIFYQKPKEGYGFIYKYTSPSNKIYIGQTINSLASRARNIVSGIGYKKCTLFWKAIQKYSFSKFQVEILCEVEIKELNYWEEYYIKLYNSFVPNGYNLTCGGEGGKKQEVYVYSAQNGKFLEHYSSVSEASMMTQVPIETISTILNMNGKRKQCHNLIFTKNFINNIDISLLSKKNKKVYVYDLEGNFYKEFNSITEASQYLKISDITISRHIKDEKSSFNFYFRDTKTDKIIPINKKDKEGKKVCQIDPLTYNIINVYPSLSSAAKAVGLSNSSSISRAIERNGKSKGYYWRIIEGSTTKCLENPTKTARDTTDGEDIV